MGASSREAPGEHQKAPGHQKIWMRAHLTTQILSWDIGKGRPLGDLGEDAAAKDRTGIWIQPHLAPGFTPFLWEKYYGTLLECDPCHQGLPIAPQAHALDSQDIAKTKPGGFMWILSCDKAAQCNWWWLVLRARQTQLSVLAVWPPPVTWPFWGLVSSFVKNK